MLLLCNYPDKYRKDTKQSFKWLNENAALCDFEYLNELLSRLNTAVEATKEIRSLFDRKNAYIFVSAFKTFIESGRSDSGFGEFMAWFVNGGNQTEIEGKHGNYWIQTDPILQGIQASYMEKSII